MVSGPNGGWKDRGATAPELSGDSAAESGDAEKHGVPASASAAEGSTHPGKLETLACETDEAEEREAAPDLDERPACD